ncbi:MAG TPA: bifunctional diaminohydroxyphosphoribosylaminopyrimidine deaminase/5-amino-6-(5-phosphoribosylamino)uracil reductase RibD [Blastocatellia bacterium]
MVHNEQRYMRMALKLARRGSRRNSAQPLIGAVAVSEDRPAGYGYSNAGSNQSAALAALEQAGAKAAGSELYTNIEPCLDASDVEGAVSRLIAMRPSRVVIGGRLHSSDTTESTHSRDVTDRIRSAGITVDVGVIEGECRELNSVYYKYAETGLPFVTVKFAASLDGQIATATGDSQWISGKPSLKLAHELRRDHDAVMVGIGTVLLDDPQLTVRLVDGPSPLRVIVDGRLRIPPSAKVLSAGDPSRTLIATTDRANPHRMKELEDMGIPIRVLPRLPVAMWVQGPPEKREFESETPELLPVRVDLSALLKLLGETGVGSILVEGGAGIITALLASRKADRLVVAIAPKIIGRGIPAVGDLRIHRLSDAITFSSVKTRKLGKDIIFDGRFDL